MKVYISYRRSDSESHAGRLADRLDAHFGTGSVSMDMNSIQFGKDFRAAIAEQIESSDIVLVLIGKTWLRAADDSGRRRLDDPSDFVRLEIEIALSRQIPVIPVLVDGASMPEIADLPRTIQALAERQAVQLRPDPEYRADIDRLIGALEHLVKAPPQRKRTVQATSAIRGESKLEAEGSASPKPPETIPLNLADYSLSSGSSAILTNALARSPDALSTGLVMLEMSDLGRPGPDPQWIGDFLRQEVSAYPVPYENLIAQYHRSGPQKKDSPRMTPGLAWSLDQAREIAFRTTGGREIYGRHLLAGLIIEAPPPRTPGAHIQLKTIGIDVPLLRQRLYEWVRGYGDNDSEWRSVLIGANLAPPTRAAFSADGTSGPDLLNLDQDVLALATLVAARDTAPPLSIGLFGDWGSGKTFFMGQLRRTVARLSKEARDSGQMQRELPFYKRIVQIEFNAWHYVEGNLWASMVDHILDNLRVSEEQPASVTESLQKHWIAQLGFAEKAQTEASQKTQQAAARVEAAEAAVTQAKKTHDDKQAELQELSKKSAAREFELSGALPVIQQALAPLGLKEVSAAVTDLQSSLRQARSLVERGSVVLTPLLHAPDRKTRWRSLLVILAAAPVSAAVLAWLLALLGQERIAQISGFATFAAGLLVTGAKWIRRQAEWMSQRAKAVEDAQRAYDEALARELADTAQNIARAEQELALARQDYALAQQRAEQARRERETAVADLAAATTSRLLDRFIQDRAASSDYRKHLGVLAIVRQDFQQLSRLIEEDNWRLAPETPGDQRFSGGLKKIASLDEEMVDAERRINRIVLYIDDLDRCPPAKVVDVLQAVHLLLAFPLFVVVVAVDARWVSRSLETRYRELLHVDDAPAAIDFASMFGVARSEDYLEKIFQIPLWLRTMDASSARRMAQGLLRQSSAAPERGKGVGIAAPPVSHDAPATPKPREGAGDAASPPIAAEAPAATPASALPKPLAPNLESLQVGDFEINAIDALSPLLGRSPRALKRFVNLYRLIKAGLTKPEHDALIRRSENGLADYQAVLFLLAVDTGLPRLSRAVFDVLHALRFAPETSGLDMKGCIERLEQEGVAGTPDWATLRSWLSDPKHTNQDVPDWVRRLVTWAPRVARYSFQAALIESARGQASTLGSKPDWAKKALA